MLSGPMQWSICPIILRRDRQVLYHFFLFCKVVRYCKCQFTSCTRETHDLKYEKGFLLKKKNSTYRLTKHYSVHLLLLSKPCLCSWERELPLKLQLFLCQFMVYLSETKLQQIPWSAEIESKTEYLLLSSVLCWWN